MKTKTQDMDKLEETPNDIKQSNINYKKLSQQNQDL